MRSDSIREKEVKKVLERIHSIKNQVGHPHFNLSKEETSTIKLKTDNKIAHGKFKAGQVKGLWMASEQTIRAVKKDLFALGGSLDEISELYECESCKKNLDKQFWNFCPFCTERFRE